ncbi:MAG: DEAD/DEAH box helicase [Bacteroidetes bacterium]|nr:DEAD/DEAH box helicase [Bacteroidota bacterium]MBK6837117.1 DEAD/DEAH box helicase [Bacteroidota bacterium]MBK9541232.1 DEAD/DEAH box helicase [Bacteroidota bacterium]MBL0258891.1 DEAD/DEAH box helicase [Bacteroidota bacterium]MBP6403190.1 DEAD/DEAH box helicase [Bacteroidia bacterium]
MSSNSISFSDFKLNKQLLTAIAEAGFETPTTIQCKAIPLILGGSDVLGIAQTGTGKTAAYLLPVLMKIKYAQGHDPRALILVPTRELAMQVAEHIRMFAKNTDLRFMAVYGGVGMKPQVEALKKGIDILVATPGRLMDLYLPGHVNLKEVRTFIMDEAERLLDMGFKRQIDRILEVVPRKRQNLLFTATWNEKVKSITQNFLVSPTEIRVAPEIKTARTVSQVVYFVPNLRTKINLLEYLIEDPAFRKVIVFCKTKNTATNLSRYLTRKYGEEFVRVVHGNKDQNTRVNSIQSFKDEEVRFLVTTDVAARGIDIEEVSHVINFDVPLIYEDYIHRIGRTGRAFRTGDSITFCAPNDEYHLKKIQKLIGQKIPVLSMPDEIDQPVTPYEEQQVILREVDMQRRKEDPTYQGAFHERKDKTEAKKVVKKGARKSVKKYFSK